MIVEKTRAGVVFAAAAFLVTLAVPSSVQAQAPQIRIISMCQAELARLYQQIDRCSDDACRRQVQLAIARHNGRCR